MITTGSEIALRQQLAKLQKNCRQESIQTRYRYFAGAKRFADFLGAEFKLQKIENVRDKHIVAYVKDMQSRELAASTIKNDLSAIRFVFGLTDSNRQLLDNQTLAKNLDHGLEKRSFGKVPKAWSHSEIEAAQALAIAQGKPHIASEIAFAANFGLRIHETIKLSKDHLTRALSEDELTIGGKNGLVRAVPVTSTGRQLLLSTLDTAVTEGKKNKLYVPQGQLAHQAMKSLENWIYRYRDQFSEGDRVLVYHGIRHHYAQAEYKHDFTVYHDDRLARLSVASKLGHGRDSVTRIYLAGMDLDVE